MPEQTLMPGTNWQVGSNTAQPQKGVHSMFQKRPDGHHHGRFGIVDDAPVAGII
jgi:hypothetical protein